jgi:hypothetical protein
MIPSMLILAAEEVEKSKTPFYLAGSLLVAFAIVISVVGFKRPDFPADTATARGVMALGATLVAATALAILYVSN